MPITQGKGLTPRQIRQRREREIRDHYLQLRRVGLNDWSLKKIDEFSYDKACEETREFCAREARG